MRRLVAGARPFSRTVFRAVPPGPGGSPLEAGYSFEAGNRYNPPGLLSALYFADDAGRASLEAGLSPGWCEVFEVEARGIPGVVALDDAGLAALCLERSIVTRSRLELEGYRTCRGLGLAVFQAGGCGLLFPSALPGAAVDAMNLVLFPAPLLPRAGVRVIRALQAGADPR